MPSERTLALGRRIACGLLGVDALYRATSDDGDGLVVLNLDRTARLVPERYGTWDDACEAFADLREHAALLSEPDRRVYYDQVCSSTLAFITWRAVGLPFESQISEFLHVPASPVSDAELSGLLDELYERLGEAGFHGSLRQRCAAWEARCRVPPDEVTSVLEALLGEAWDRTESHVMEIPAPRSDGMRVATVSGVPYNARCDFLARTIELNIDPTLTLPGLRHLAVHEGYPGHYLQFILRQQMAESGEAAADVLLSVVNTASSSTFEGIADTGLEMLGWTDSADDRIQSLLNRHRAAIGTIAAWRLHAGRRPADEVKDGLSGAALVGGDGWIENRMRFISSPARAALIWSYWWGERSVAPEWRRVPVARRPEFLRFLYGRMHSTETVAMFDA